jgi:hypothetical protein
MVVGSHMLVALSVPVGVIDVGVTVGDEVSVTDEASEVAAEVVTLEPLEPVATDALLVNVAEPIPESMEDPLVELVVVVAESVPFEGPPVGEMVADPDVMMAVPDEVPVSTVVLLPVGVEDPEPISVVVVEVGTTRESVPPAPVLVGVTDAESVLVVVSDPTPLVMLGITLVTLPTSVVDVGTTDPRSLVTLPKILVTDPIRDPESLVEVGVSVLVAKMLEITLAKSVVGVGVADETSDETGVTMAPVEAPDDEGRMPERMLETRFASVVVLEVVAETGVLELGSAVVVGVTVAEEDTSLALELASLVAGADVPAAELPEAVPVKEIPSDAVEVVVGTSVEVLEDVTTPPGPKVIALPDDDAVAVVSVTAALEEAVGVTTSAGTDPVDAITESDAVVASVAALVVSEEAVGETTTAGADPVEPTEESVEVVGSGPTMVVCWITTVVTVSELLAVGWMVVPGEPPDGELEVSLLVPVMDFKKSVRSLDDCLLDVVDFEVNGSCVVVSFDVWTGVKEVMVELVYMARLICLGK